jgi:hypothetical protein
LKLTHYRPLALRLWVIRAENRNKKAYTGLFSKVGLRKLESGDLKNHCADREESGRNPAQGIENYWE